MIERAELRSLIDGIARRFENRVHSSEEELGVKDVCGWGQFLDDPTQQRQVGPYGTAAGLVVRSLANRGSDQLAEKVSLIVKTWWEHRLETADERKLFGQITRVSMLHLATRLARLPNTDSTLQNMQATLLKSLRPDGMWGNYVIPGVVEDASPRLFPTAIAILSFTLFLPEDQIVPEELIRAAEGLEEKILGSKDLPRLHFAAAAAAILSAKRKSSRPEVLRRIKKVAYATQVSLPDLGVYFYDYEYPDDDGKQKFGRDYFILPTEVLLGIAGFQIGAPAYLRLRSELSLASLVKNIRGYDGYYRPDNEQRVSSMNQCWVAVFLSLAAQTRERVIGSRIPFWLRRQRRDSFAIDTIMLLLCLVGICFGMAFESFPPQTILSPSSLIIKALSAVLAFIAGRLYAPTFVKELFAGRE